MRFSTPISDLLTLEYLRKSTYTSMHTPTLVTVHGSNGPYQAIRYKGSHEKPKSYHSSLSASNLSAFINSPSVDTPSKAITNTYSQYLSKIDEDLKIVSSTTFNGKVDLLLNKTDKQIDAFSLLELKQALPNYQDFTLDPRPNGIHLIVNTGESSGTFKTHGDAKDFFGSFKDESQPFFKWFKGSDEEELVGISAYANGGDGFSKFIGPYLRSQPRKSSDDSYTKYSPSEIDGVERLGKSLDKAISRFELTKDIQTFRVVNSINEDSSKGMLEKLVECSKADKPFVEDSYCSTSAVKGGFKVRGKQRIHLKIQVPKGKGVGLWITPLSNYSNESEFLLARGTAFKVLTDMSKVDLTQSDIEVELKIVGRQEIPWEAIRKGREDLVDNSPQRPKSIFNPNKVRFGFYLQKYLMSV